MKFISSIAQCIGYLIVWLYIGGAIGFFDFHLCVSSPGQCGPARSAGQLPTGKDSK